MRGRDSSKGFLNVNWIPDPWGVGYLSSLLVVSCSLSSWTPPNSLDWISYNHNIMAMWFLQSEVWSTPNTIGLNGCGSVTMWSWGCLGTCSTRAVQQKLIEANTLHSEKQSIFKGFFSECYLKGVCLNGFLVCICTIRIINYNLDKESGGAECSWGLLY